MRKHLTSVAIGALSIPLLGGAAYAAAHSVSDRPAPQVVISPAPVAVSRHRSSGTSTTTDDHGVDPATSTTVDDRGHDGPGHDVGDDHGVDPATSSTSTTVDDRGHDGPGHDVGDDHGGSRSGSGSDDGGSSGHGHG